MGWPKKRVAMVLGPPWLDDRVADAATEYSVRSFDSVPVETIMRRPWPS
jgi:hypothetical protein